MIIPISIFMWDGILSNLRHFNQEFEINRKRANWRNGRIFLDIQTENRDEITPWFNWVISMAIYPTVFI
jgi:hypothetical protein